MRILWVKSGPLFPPDTGGKIRTLNMLRAMSRAHHVCYLSLLPDSSPLQADEDKDGYAARKEWIPFKEHARRSPAFFAALAASLFSSKPFALTKHFSHALRERLIEFDEAGEFDLIVCDFLASALHFAGRNWKTPAVLFQHNMEAQIWKRMAENQSHALGRWFLGIQFRRMQAWEARLSALFDGVITVSPEDTRHARQHYALTNVLGDVPPGVDTEYFSIAPVECKGPPVLAFLGSMDWLPNVEGVLWFVREVYPLIKRSRPDVRLRVVGRRPDAAIRRLADADGSIEVTGTVSDVRPLLRDARAMVVPLLAGGGTRIKILEAMALGLPVISTTVGAEGLPFQNGSQLLITDEADGMARACLDVIDQQSLAHRLSTEARREVESLYSWQAASSRFIDLSAPLCFPKDVQTQQPKGKSEAEGKQVHP